jgi:activator of HSP90 ATPase
MKTKTIRHSVALKASPHAVYEALIDSKKHSEFTGDKASISRKIGGKFSTFNGYSTGVNLELVPDRRIVQTWRASDWPDDHFSTVKFELKKEGSGTRLIFTQTGVPEEKYEEISDGWKEYYWDRLVNFFRGGENEK